jgi:hypothetical protein
LFLFFCFVFVFLFFVLSFLFLLFYSESAEGTILKFPLESMPRGFQDPFFSCDPPPPLPPLMPALTSLYSYPTLYPTHLSPSSPRPPSFGTTSGLLVGANVKGGFWDALLRGKSNVWQVLSTGGIKMFFNVCFFISHFSKYYYHRLHSKIGVADWICGRGA